MPYFRRMPIEGIADAVLARATIPGLPSRGTALPAAIAASALPTAPVATATGIVEQAAAVLSSEPSRIHPVPYARRAANIDASPQSAWAGQLEAQVKTLVDQFVALAIQAPALDGAMPPGMPFAGSNRLPDTAQMSIDPAPVLSPPGPVAPGGTAQITIGRAPDSTLVLDDDYASNNHAALSLVEGRWVVRDLGSTNGTWIGRTRLTAPAELIVGQQLRVGRTTLELRK